MLNYEILGDTIVFSVIISRITLDLFWHALNAHGSHRSLGDQRAHMSDGSNAAFLDCRGEHLSIIAVVFGKDSCEFKWKSHGLFLAGKQDALATYWAGTVIVSSLRNEKSFYNIPGTQIQTDSHNFAAMAALRVVNMAGEAILEKVESLENVEDCADFASGRASFCKWSLFPLVIGDHSWSMFQYGKGRSVFYSLCCCLQVTPANISTIMSQTNEGYLKDLVQEKTGFPRYRLTLLLADGKSWEELGRPQEVQAVFNQVTTDMADELMHLGSVGLVRESEICWCLKQES